jgi:prepilin-type N-terminal cleavage/methylation domain-containing protein
MKKIRQMLSLKKAQKGFTIIEILIALPIATLLSVTMSTTMFNQYGQLQQGTTKSRLRMEGEIILLSLEDELLFATDFASTRSTDLTDINAPSGGWTYNTTPTDTLIVYETALTADRRDPNREFVYKRQTNCSSSFNIAINNLIYFTTQNTNDTYRTLYRRTLVPQYTTCGTNYKKQTCPAGAVISPCSSADSKLSEKVVDFQLEYFNEDNVAVAGPATAQLVKMTLTLGEKIYGKEVVVPTTITMKKVN